MKNNIFGYPTFDNTGKKIITRTSGAYASSLQNITVYKLSQGKEQDFFNKTEEMAVLLVEGGITLNWDGGTVSCTRKNFIEDDTICLHVCKKHTVHVKALVDSEILVQMTENPQDFDSILYTSKNTRNEIFGKDQFEGKAQRQVRTFFDYSNAPYSKMVCGEIIIPQGGWSS